ncbi:hypothetical protein [Rugosimonospora africana]|uniref:Uncharacterized protein n=1 Tax=Rugosimonospora africana TaxID=556532 RepID=A0A8J3R436_9ACTN|nr:hypothetical protein [Rugosimonospora africana]GIH21107.1 hypothetical protein Raf01_92790 [Rugosimonospora africana]
MPVLLLIASMAVVAGLWLRRGRSDGDTPTRLVTAAIPALPAHRREWGQAMVAELAQVHGRAQRWRFAAGVLRVVLFPPPRHPGRALPVAAAGVTAATVATIAAVREVPNLSVFVATLSLLLCGYATVAGTRSARPRRSLPHVIVAAIAVIAATAAVATVLRVAVTHPAATADPTHVFSVLFAALLTGYLGFALAARRLSDGAVPWWALAATLASGGAWALTTLATSAVPDGVSAFLSPVATAATLAAAIGASATAADRTTGVRAGALTIALSAPLHFAAGMTAQLRVHHDTLTNPYDIAAFPHSGYPDAASYLLSDAIAGAILTGFVLSPIVLGVLALLGAAAGTRLRQLGTRSAPGR